MPHLFFEHVAKPGEADYPKSLSSRLPLDVFEQDLARLAPQDVALLKERHNTEGGLFCWGMPEGARGIFRRFQRGDRVLLVGPLWQSPDGGWRGKVDWACQVDIAIPGTSHTTSRRVWGNTGYPLVFICNPYPLNIPWEDFCQAVGYKANWMPAGRTYQVDERKRGLLREEDVESFVWERLRESRR